MRKLGAFSVRVSKVEVERFNRSWPCSPIVAQSYWFEFAGDRSLVDHNIPEAMDGEAVSAMAKDCERYLFDKVVPKWRHPGFYKTRKQE